MKFSAKEDIEAPIDAVFDMVSDFDVFERAAMLRGAEVRRGDAMTAPGSGMTWEAAFVLRGKRREVSLTLDKFDPPIGYAVAGDARNMTGEFTVELLALSRQRTRLAIQLDIKPKTLSARLLIQSLRLVKTKLTKRFKLRIAEYARNLEERYKRSA